MPIQLGLHRSSTPIVGFCFTQNDAKEDVLRVILRSCAEVTYSWPPPHTGLGTEARVSGHGFEADPGAAF